MESRILILFLNVALAVTAGLAATYAGAAETERTAVIEPEVERRDIRPPRIDSENFELGLFAGQMSVEDFGSNLVTGLQLAYHIGPALFVEGVYGRTDTDRTSFERLSGAAELLTEEEREFTFYNLSLGYNILPGEGFIGSRRAFNTALYLIGGLGSSRFAGDDRFTVHFGAGYRFLATDWLAVHLDVRDYLFEIDLLGENKTTHNIELHAGLTFFF